MGLTLRYLLALSLVISASTTPLVGYVPDDQPLSLLTYNVFFLPGAAKAVSDGWGWWKKDFLRAKWIGNHLARRSDDFICLMETFRLSPRKVIAETLRNAEYNVIEHFNRDGFVLANSGLSFATKHEILEHDFRLYKVHFVVARALSVVVCRSLKVIVEVSIFFRVCCEHPFSCSSFTYNVVAPSFGIRCASLSVAGHRNKSKRTPLAVPRYRVSSHTYLFAGGNVYDLRNACPKRSRICPSEGR